MQEQIEYAIVALGLSGPEVARIVKEATGVTVEPASKPAATYLQSLDASQLQAIWNRLSRDYRWASYNPR
jgi:hypothetical protein